jgi:hypothetical protein
MRIGLCGIFLVTVLFSHPAGFCASVNPDAELLSKGLRYTPPEGWVKDGAMKEKLGQDAVYYRDPTGDVYITVGFPKETSPKTHADNCKKIEIMTRTLGRSEKLGDDACHVVEASNDAYGEMGKVIAYQCMNDEKHLEYYVSYGSRRLEDYEKHFFEFKKSLLNLQLIK